MRRDPCFRCPLPDCDERSPHCALRQAANHYSRLLDRGIEPNREERDDYNAWFRMYAAERKARLSEARHGA